MILGDDQNFHIFHSMLKGLKDKKQFCLEDGKYKMMGTNTAENPSVIPFDRLMEAFKMLGFRDEELNSILAMLAAVVILGEVEFSGSGDSSEVSGGSAKHITRYEQQLHPSSLVFENLYQDHVWALKQRTYMKFGPLI